jgi:hypothetical protein
MLVAFTLVTGLAYPLVVTGIGQSVFHSKANWLARRARGARGRLRHSSGSSSAIDEYFLAASLRGRRRIRPDCVVGLESRPDQRRPPRDRSPSRVAQYRAANGSTTQYSYRSTR